MDRTEGQNSKKALYNGFYSQEAKPLPGTKITITGVVLCQFSRATDTPRGRVYSHSHIITDDMGHQYHYRGSSFFPQGSRISITATVKAYARHHFKNVTIIKAPKSI